MTIDELIVLAIKLAMPDIQYFEAGNKCKLQSYIVAGEEHKQATIAWGRAIPLSMHPMRCTQEQADAWLTQDIAARIHTLRKFVSDTILLRMPPAMLASCISWMYNSIPELLIHSASFKALQNGDFQGWLNGMSQWTKGGEPPKTMGGLVRRRAAERHFAERGSWAEIVKLNYYMDLIPIAQHNPKGKLYWDSTKTRMLWK